MGKSYRAESPTRSPFNQRIVVSRVTTTIIVEREMPDDDEIEFEVEVCFCAHKAYRGARDTICRPGDGQPLEPDEPAWLEFESATVNGQDFELDADEIDKARDQAEEECADAAMDYRDSPPWRKPTDL